MRKLLILLALNSSIGLSNEIPLYLIGIAGDVGVFQYKNKTTFVKVGERLPTGEKLLDFKRFSVMTNKGEKHIERIKDYDKEIKEFFSIVDDETDNKNNIAENTNDEISRDPIVIGDCFRYKDDENDYYKFVRTTSIEHQISVNFYNGDELFHLIYDDKFLLFKEIKKIDCPQ